MVEAVFFLKNLSIFWRSTFFLDLTYIFLTFPLILGMFLFSLLLFIPVKAYIPFFSEIFELLPLLSSTLSLPIKNCFLHIYYQLQELLFPHLLNRSIRAFLQTMSCWNCLAFPNYLPTDLADLYGNVDHSEEDSFHWHCSICGDTLFNYQALVKFTWEKPHVLSGQPLKAIMTHNEFETYLQELEPKLAGMTFTVKILFFKILTCYDISYSTQIFLLNLRSPSKIMRKSVLIFCRKRDTLRWITVGK